VATMTTPPRAEDAPVTGDHAHRLVVFNRWLLGAVVVLAAALAVLAVYTFVGFGSFGASANEQLLDDLAAAWSANDHDALAEVYDPSAIYEAGTNRAVGLEEITQLSDRMAAQDFRVDRVGDILEGDSGYVAATFDYSWANGASNGQFFTVFRIQNGLVTHHWDH
jgi:hypothetical protein